MDCSKTVDFFMERNRICRSEGPCDGCVLLSKDGNCLQDIVETAKQINKLVDAVQKWSDEHPQKTYAQDFWEKFPNAQKDIEEWPRICRARCYGTKRPNSCGETGYCCSDCWNEPMEGN